MSKLAGKVAIITGGGRGVGRGIALALSAEGANVVICGRTLDALDAVRREIEQRGGTATAVVCDITNQLNREKLIAEAIERCGRIDILVNNAALVPHGSLLTIDDELIQAAWEAGPIATLQLMRLCHPHLRGGGSIINISSAASIQAHARDRGIYAAVKASLNAISRAAANEWGPDGIRVNTVMPFANTEAVENFFAKEPAYAQSVLAGMPLGRVGDCEADIGRAVVFLASQDAAYITGVTLPVDGGASYIR